jgi:hypothetical protein
MVSFVLTFVVLFELSPALNSILEFVPFPSPEFRMQLVKIILGDMAATVAVESAAHLLLYKVRSEFMHFLFSLSHRSDLLVMHLEQRACASKNDKL